MVWRGRDGTDYEVFLYDGHGETIQLTDNDYYDYLPQINSRGQVVWYAESESYDEIWLYSPGRKGSEPELLWPVLD